MLTLHLTLSAYYRKYFFFFFVSVFYNFCHHYHVSLKSGKQRAWDCKLFWYPKFYDQLIIVSLANRHWLLLFDFDWLVSVQYCPNYSTNNFLSNFVDHHLECPLFIVLTSLDSSTFDIEIHVNKEIAKIKYNKKQHKCIKH